MADPPATVEVIGLGPAGEELLTEGTRAVIASSPVRFLRTARHPAASALDGAASFDELYEAASTFDDVYATIVERVVAAANEHGRVVYAVPGSPVVAERTVEMLLADARVHTRVHPALSALDLAWARLGVDPVQLGVRIVDGHRFATEAAGERGPLLVVQVHDKHVLSDVKLSVDDGDAVTVLHHLGLDDERIYDVEWSALDREVAPDHLTMLWIPTMREPVASALARLDALVHVLREQCPWDRAQTHRSLLPYAVEEVHEVVEAVETDDVDGMEEELGDLLLQVFLHATLAEEDGAFTLADVATQVHDKMVRRHPHVFADADAADAAAVDARWDALKRAEKPHAGPLDGVPTSLPALARLEALQRKAAKVGFDWDGIEGPLGKLDEELAEVREVIEARAAGATDDAEDAVAAMHEVGDLLLAVVSLGRHLGVDAEAAARAAARRFTQRFAAVEAGARDRGMDVAAARAAGTLAELWESAKQQEGGAPA